MKLKGEFDMSKIDKLKAEYDRLQKIENDFCRDTGYEVKVPAKIVNDRYRAFIAWMDECANQDIMPFV